MMYAAEGAEAREQTAREFACVRIDRQIMTLDGLVKQLNERLSPVLIPEAPTNTDSSMLIGNVTNVPVPKPRTELDHSLYNLHQTLAESISRLEALTYRVSV